MKEVPELRGENSKTFLDEETGAFVTELSSDYNHYRDSDGNWKPPDPRVRTSGEKQVLDGVPYDLVVPQDPKNEYAELGGEDYTIQFRLRDHWNENVPTPAFARASERVSKPVSRLEDELPEARLGRTYDDSAVYIDIENDRIELMYLHENEDEMPDSFVLDIQTEGVEIEFSEETNTAEMTEAEYAELCDTGGENADIESTTTVEYPSKIRFKQDGETKHSLNKLTYLDADGDTHPAHMDVEGFEDGNLTLRIAVPKGWASDAAFPILLDPEMVTGSWSSVSNGDTTTYEIQDGIDILTQEVQWRGTSTTSSSTDRHNNYNYPNEGSRTSGTYTVTSATPGDGSGTFQWALSSTSVSGWSSDGEAEVEVWNHPSWDGNDSETVTVDSDRTQHSVGGLFERTFDSGAMGQSNEHGFEILSNTGPRTVGLDAGSSTSNSRTAYDVTTTTTHDTEDPTVTINGESTTGPSSLNDGSESDWYSMDGLEPGTVNEIDHSINGSGEADFRLRYEWELAAGSVMRTLTGQRLETDGCVISTE